MFGASSVAQEINSLLFGARPLAEPIVVAITNELASGSVPANHAAIARALLGRSDRSVHPTAWQVQFSADDVHYKQLEGFELALDRFDHSVSLAIALDAYENHMMSFFRAHIKAGDVALDIGANIGLYTMQFAHLVGSEGRVVAFEPNSENCRLLLLSQIRNGFTNIELIPVALSDQRSAHLFTTCMGSNGSLSDYRHDVLSPGCTVVPTFRLDSLAIDRADVMKLDVEGAEFRVLTGADSVIQKFRPLITTEFSTEMLMRISGTSGSDYFAWFAQRNYAPFLIPRDGKAIQPIDDIGGFLASYGDFQIEDLAFFPR